MKKIKIVLIKIDKVAPLAVGKAFDGKRTGCK